MIPKLLQIYANSADMPEMPTNICKDTRSYKPELFPNMISYVQKEGIYVDGKILRRFNKLNRMSSKIYKDLRNEDVPFQSIPVP